MIKKELKIIKSTQKIYWNEKELVYSLTKGEDEYTISTETGDEFLLTSSYPIYTRTGNINNVRAFLNNQELKVISVKQSEDILSLIIKQ